MALTNADLNAVQLAVAKGVQDGLRRHRQECPVNELVVDIWGNGSENRPGMKMRLDRLEQQKKGSNNLLTWFANRVLGPIIAAVLAALAVVALTQR